MQRFVLKLNRGRNMKKYFNDERDVFFEKRFGLFIHWGIYSVAGWHEQHGYRGGVDRHEYAKFADKFNPMDFNPGEWVDLAEKTGMQYICFTSKHIDGFCMFDTEYTDFNIMNTPYGKDILKELSDECHRRNFPLAIYYSPIDRNNPLYPSVGRAYENKEHYPKDTPDMERYMEYLKGQVTELCTNYGKLHAFWWDGGRHMEHCDESVNELVRNLQPGILINNRGFSDGDFRTPERDWDEYVDNDLVFEVPTEACQSIGTESWGYRINEDYYSTRHLIESIDKILAKGGNYLLNAGPMSDGRFPDEAIKILGEIGGWYRNVCEAFIDTEPYQCGLDNKDVLITKKGHDLYIHLYKFPKSHVVWLKPLYELPKSAVVLNDNSTVETFVEMTPTIFKEEKPFLRISGIPVSKFANEVIVIRLEY